MDKLTGVLKALCDKPEALKEAVNALEGLAPTPSERQAAGQCVQIL